ncbi:Macrolide export ATP-binding/permease protein MacB [subsurface metagenome]
MKLIESLAIAIRSLTTNKLRSSLTMLGIIIGVGSVIAIMAGGRGMESYVTSTLEDLGTDVLYVTPVNPDAPGAAAMAPGYATANLTLDDAEAIARIPSVLGVAPTNENFVELTFGDESIASVIEGTTPEFIEAMGYEMGDGQFISERNVASRDMVVVLGSETAEDLFGDEDPLGQKVKIKGKRFTVIGVMAFKGGSMFGFSMDEMVIVPITTYQARLFTMRTPSGEDAVQSIAVRVAGPEAMDAVTADIETTLRKRHHIDEDEKDDFSIVSMEQMIGVFSDITGVVSIFLAAIASIGLLVASIGIMNIMLVSVTERTREIGIRKAVGAKRRDILLQFLLEAAALSLVGGAAGIAFGWMLSLGMSIIATLAGFPLQATLSPLHVILAVGVSVFIGLASGMYPAMRAARLNPIDALHYE